MSFQDLRGYDSKRKSSRRKEGSSYKRSVSRERRDENEWSGRVYLRSSSDCVEKHRKSSSRRERDVSSSRRRETYDYDEPSDDELPPHENVINSSRSRPPRSPRHRAPATRNHTSQPSKSSYTLLSDDVVRFQKLVTEISMSYERAGNDPAYTWKSRIQTESAQELAESIDSRIRDNEEFLPASNQKSQKKIAARISKLSRDFQRSRSSLEDAIARNNLKQIDDIQNITAFNEATVYAADSASHERMQQRTLQKQEEQSLRVLRARENEIDNINRKVHQVNEIFKELGDVVSSQQEQVDKYEENIFLSQAYATVGKEHIEKANRDPYGLAKFGFAVERSHSQATAPTVRSSSDLSTFDSEKGSGTNDAAKLGQLIQEDELHWSLPFETFGEDLKEVQSDLASLGSQLVGAGISHLRAAKGAMLGCAANLEMLEFSEMDDTPRSSQSRNRTNSF